MELSYILKLSGDLTRLARSDNSREGRAGVRTHSEIEQRIHAAGRAASDISVAEVVFRWIQLVDQWVGKEVIIHNCRSRLTAGDT